MQTIDTIRIDLPNSWRQVPADREGLEEVMAAMRRTEQWPTLKPAEQRQVEIMMQRLLVDVEGAGVRFAAVYSDVIDDVPAESPADSTAEGSSATSGTADGDGNSANVAYLLVSMLSSADFGTTLPMTPAVLQAALSLTRPRAEDGPTVTNLAPPEIVTIRAGQAVLLRRLVEQRLKGFDSLMLYSQSYFVPVPTVTDRLVVLQFLTPQVGDSEVFGRYFAAVANGVRFYGEGDSTDL